MNPTYPRCEYLVNPLGIDVESPRFSWECESSDRDVRQSAYQIIVASSESTLGGDVGDKWDSGRIESSHFRIAYEGAPLTSRERCWWKVRVWDQDGNTRDSSPAWFEMGLLNEGDWDSAWIAGDDGVSSPLLRAECVLDKAITRARAYVSGIGYYEMFINGERVGDHVLDPVSTNYNRAGQAIEKPGRVLYVTHDVTNLLKTGTNVIGVMLGNGWYSFDEEADCKIAYGDKPQLLLRVNAEYADGTCASIVSDGAWKACSGPITANDIYNGEIHDARLEKDGWTSPGFDDGGWDTVTIVDPPGGVLSAQMLPPSRVVETIMPVKMTQPADGVYIFDMGQHFSGWARLRVTGERGTNVVLRFAGALHNDGTLDVTCNWGAQATDTYILRGGGEEMWEPRFTFHGFQYVEVTGYPGVPTLDGVDGRVVRTALDSSGQFECSNELLNQIHGNIHWTFASSYQGIPQDAAERNERHGWLGDPGFVAEDYMLNFDDASFWSKWLIDIRDAQKADGETPVISPLHSMPRDAWQPWPAWHSSYPLFTWLVYQNYSDERVIVEHFDGIRKLIDHLTTTTDDHILRYGLGDHMEPIFGSDPPDSTFMPNLTPPSLTSTAYYYYDVRIFADMARIIGRTDEAEHYGNLADRIRDAFNTEFLDEATGQYATGSQTANALPLYLGMVPENRRESIAKSVVDDVRNHDGHLTTGIIGTNALVHVLSDWGYTDVLYGIATKTTYPSWGYAVVRGATTLWESFDGSTRSLNMKMFGSIEKFLFTMLAGVRSGAPGYGHVVIKPCIVGERHARASIRTVRGPVAVDWKLTDGGIDMDVTIPVSATAEVHVPTMGFENVAIEEGGRVIWRDGLYTGCDGIHTGSERDDYVMFETGSGAYSFTVRSE
jgi:alpha-L-rhamnosidase